MIPALIISTAGTNCDRELAVAFERAGATVSMVHLNVLRRDPSMVDRFALIGLPGGFSYGDAIAAGRVQAQLLRQVYPALATAVARGAGIIAPCNGFQVAVQLGLLPGPSEGAALPSSPPTPTTALAPNLSGRFIDRWVRVTVPKDTRCIWTSGVSIGHDGDVLPVAHGEGRFVTEDDATLRALESTGRIALRYASEDNPNGSVEDIAGICDASGLVFGLMPHPERFTRWTQHPRWTRLGALDALGEPLGLQMFRNAVRHAESVDICV